MQFDVTMNWQNILPCAKKCWMLSSSLLHQLSLCMCQFILQDDLPLGLQVQEHIYECVDLGPTE